MAAAHFRVIAAAGRFESSSLRAGICLRAPARAKSAKPDAGKVRARPEALRSFADSFDKERRMKDERGLTVFFNDGSKMSLVFPKQSLNETAAELKIEDVLKRRYMLFEADSKFLMIPFENVKYIQLDAAPPQLQGHTYIRNASIVS
jgi:hypothetical protein